MEGCPKIMDKLVILLRKNGHECMVIEGITNHQFKWCEKDICPETIKNADMKQRTKETETRIRLLEQKGHTCIQVYEIYPPKIAYFCNRDICENLTKK